MAAGAVGAGAAGAALALAVVLRGLLHLEVAAHASANVRSSKEISSQINIYVVTDAIR